MYEMKIPDDLALLFTQLRMSCVGTIALFIRCANPDRGIHDGTCLDRGRRKMCLQAAYHRCTMRLPLIIQVYTPEILGKSRLQSS